MNLLFHLNRVCLERITAMVPKTAHLENVLGSDKLWREYSAQVEGSLAVLHPLPPG